jgi:transaldolase
VVPRAQFDWIKTNLGPQLHVSPQLTTYYYGFNLRRAPFKDKPALRRALSEVIDRERLAQVVLRVGEIPAYGWVPPGVHNYTSQSFDYAQQPMAERIAEAKRLYAKAGKPNLFIKIPGTKEGLPAIEAATFAGVPVNVTLLFSTSDYLAAADAYMRGLEKRVAAGLDPDVRSVASVFISRWDRAIVEDVPDELKNRLGNAIGQHAYRTYRELLDLDRWQRLENAGARPQRLLFASTSSKDKRAHDTLYVEALAAPNTVNTMPEETLRALADHGKLPAVLSPYGGDCDAVLDAHAKAGIDVDALARKLQADGAKAFVASWQDLLKSIGAKSKALA